MIVCKNQMDMSSQEAAILHQRPTGTDQSELRMVEVHFLRINHFPLHGSGRPQAEQVELWPTVAAAAAVRIAQIKRTLLRANRCGKQWSAAVATPSLLWPTDDVWRRPAKAFVVVDVEKFARIYDGWWLACQRCAPIRLL